MQIGLYFLLILVHPPMSCILNISKTSGGNTLVTSGVFGTTGASVLHRASPKPGSFTYHSDVFCYVIIHVNSSTAQGGGGSFKNRQPIGDVGCCESEMAERSHCWTERRLISLTLVHLSIYLPIYLSIYLSICLAVYLSIFGAVSFNVM